MTEVELMPCPMCGGHSALNTCRTTDMEFIRLNSRDTGYGVNCISCGLNNRGMSIGHATPAKAITAWNTRVTAKENPHA